MSFVCRCCIIVKFHHVDVLSDVGCLFSDIAWMCSSISFRCDFSFIHRYRIDGFYSFFDVFLPMLAVFRLFMLYRINMNFRFYRYRVDVLFGVSICSRLPFDSLMYHYSDLVADGARRTQSDEQLHRTRNDDANPRHARVPRGNGVLASGARQRGGRRAAARHR